MIFKWSDKTWLESFKQTLKDRGYKISRRQHFNFKATYYEKRFDILSSGNYFNIHGIYQVDRFLKTDREGFEIDFESLEKYILGLKEKRRLQKENKNVVEVSNIFVSANLYEELEKLFPGHKVTIHNNLHDMKFIRATISLKENRTIVLEYRTKESFKKIPDKDFTNVFWCIELAHHEYKFGKGVYRIVSEYVKLKNILKIFEKPEFKLLLEDYDKMIEDDMKKMEEVYEKAFAIRGEKTPEQSREYNLLMRDFDILSYSSPAWDSFKNNFKKTIKKI